MPFWTKLPIGSLVNYWRDDGDYPWGRSFMGLVKMLGHMGYALAGGLLLFTTGNYFGRGFDTGRWTLDAQNEAYLEERVADLQEYDAHWQELFSRGGLADNDGVLGMSEAEWAQAYLRSGLSPDPKETYPQYIFSDGSLERLIESYTRDPWPLGEKNSL